MDEVAADERKHARLAAGEDAAICRWNARTLLLPLPVNGMETARGRHASTQPPQLGQEGTATRASERGPGGYLGVSMGGTSRVPFRATGTAMVSPRS
jgi:hypothetical protein